MKTGEIANEHGDIFFSANCRPISAGRLALPLSQAIRALLHGWHWLETHDMSGDESWIAVQRGGSLWEVRG